MVSDSAGISPSRVTLRHFWLPTPFVRAEQTLRIWLPQETFAKVNKVLGQGNFVLIVSEGVLGGRQTSFDDLFRLGNGKIAEHWDVVEPIAPHDQWKNQNGKFGF